MNDSGPTTPPSFVECFQFTAGQITLFTSVFTYILAILPLSLFVLYVGIQRWWQQRLMSAAEPVSPSDFFTYNLAVIELIFILSSVLFVSSNNIPFVLPWVRFTSMVGWFGQTLTPILTCVERYLAVVHPVTYLGLKKVGGVRIRNISMGCVWLLSFGGAGLLMVSLKFPKYGILPAMPILVFLLASMTFCSVSALRILFHPRPGKTGQDQSKQRAIQTILVIMGVLWVKFGWNMIAIFLTYSPATVVKCLASASVLVSSLPGSLLSPLLFLHKAGKLPNCKICSEPLQ